MGIVHGSIDDCFQSPPSSFADSVGLRRATLVFLFLGDWANLRLRPRLLQTLPVGARILCRTFSLGDGWPPVAEAFGSDGKTVFRIYEVKVARKADPALNSDAELAVKFGLRWVQPPSYRPCACAA